MTDDGRFAVELFDDHLLIGGDVPDAVAGEHRRIGAGGGDVFWVVGPPGSDRDVACILEERGPPIPAGVEQPQTVDEDHGLLP